MVEVRLTSYALSGGVFKDSTQCGILIGGIDNVVLITAYRYANSIGRHGHTGGVRRSSGGQIAVKSSRTGVMP